MANYEINQTGGGGAGDGFNIIAAGTQTANTNVTVLFSDANNVTFGMNNSSRVTASASFPAQTVQPGIQSISAGGARITTGEAVFSNSNGLAFGVAGQTITGSYTVPTVPAQFTGGFSTQGNTAGDTGLVTARLLLVGGNNITLSGSTNAGSITITVSGGAGGAGDGFNILAAGTQTAQTNTTVLFSDANGIAFGMAGSSRITASYTVPTVTNSSWTVSDAATSGTVARLAFTNLNGVTLSLSTGAGGSHTIVGSHNALTAQSSQSIGMSTQTAGGATAGTTGYASGPQVLYHFAPGSNITMSQSVNGASATMSIFGPTPAAGGGTVNQFWPVHAGGVTLSGQLGQSTLHVVPMPIQGAMSFTRANHFVSMSISTSSNSSHAGAISLNLGIYTRNVSTLSLASSGSVAHSWTNTSNNSTASLSGLRMVSIPINVVMTPGDYWLALLSRTGTTNANWFTASQWLVSFHNLLWSGQLGAASATSAQMLPGWGAFSAQTAALPASIAFSQLSGGNSTSLRMPIINFVNFTA